MTSQTAPDSWILTTSRRVMRTGPGHRLPAQSGAGQFSRLSRAAEEALLDAPPGYAVVGVMPFDEHTPAVLTLAPLIIRPRARQEQSLRVATPAPQPPGDPAYLAAVAQGLHELRSGKVRKVVLARSLLVPGLRPEDAAALLHRLRQQEPDAHVFRADISPDDDAGSTLLVGASPELLLARHGNHLCLNPLAGTASRHPNPIRDHAVADALLKSPKDRREHALVVEHLAHRLQPLCAALDVPATPSLKATSHVWHLSTVIRARLRHPRPSALDLALRLHPTPAVCGSPTGDARRLIQRLESRPRGYYTGLIGWMDRHGDGQWVITLRCGELSQQGLRLYAGAGILADSCPETELAETGAKLSTLLSALPTPHQHQHTRSAAHSHDELPEGLQIIDASS